ncbi:3-keto-5-aminohexanoate cleavage enzyme [Paracoccus laeviglucosivorans]|uniref:3-keto-5-aminohexanoate cleavage enzyme n=1 Tax=Paracoccus laeviglucosivorans TaxID=1197861 RepID=A0A521B3M6_9RHOB|nr:3-keto-5-aminohexanoate cleavage enzyme [Paracoccus laeviglucosivorans]
MIRHDIKPEIKAFDLSHILQAAAMHRDGRIKGRPYVQFVMGVKNAMPAARDVFDYYIYGETPARRGRSMVCGRDRTEPDRA